MKTLVLSVMFLVACAPTTNTVQPEKKDECCRYCTNSKACGNGCIPYENVCRQPKGCACTLIVHG